MSDGGRAETASLRGVEAVAEGGRMAPNCRSCACNAAAQRVGKLIWRRQHADRSERPRVPTRSGGSLPRSWDPPDDAIISKDLNGIITSWNNGARQVFGYTADEVIGKPITILMPPDRYDEGDGHSRPHPPWRAHRSLKPSASARTAPSTSR